MEELLVDRGDGVLRLRMNRPSSLNALTDTMADALAAHLEEPGDCRVVVLTGAGRAFCSGVDLASGDEKGQLDESAVDRANRLVRLVTGLDRPVVAGVHGVAAGFGCSLALACDLQVVAESASFLLAFARIGLMPDGGTSATVAASMGRARAMRLALLGEALPAQAAYDAGLVSHLTPDETYEQALGELVARLAAGPPLAQAATKRAVNAASLGELEGALERERAGQTALLRTTDAAEGIGAFNEKRRPRFSGS